MRPFDLADYVWPDAALGRQPQQRLPIDLNHPHAKGLSLFLPLSDGFGTTALDLSGNNNHGTLTNGPSWGIGNKGKALSFDGTNDYIDISSSLTTVQSHSKGTISIRCKANNALNDSCALLFGGGPNKQCGRISLSSTGKIYCCVYDDSVGGIKWDLVTVNAFDYVSSEIQVVIAQDGVYPKIYVNGLFQNCTSPSGTPAPGAWFSSVTGLNQASIGRFSNAALTGDYFNGYISDVRIYNRALSASEVYDLYTNPFGIYANPVSRLWAIPAAAPINLSGDAQANSGTTGEATTEIPLSGAAQASASATASGDQVSQSVGLSAASASVSIADGVATVAVAISGDALSQSAASGNPNMSISLSGSALSTALAAANVTASSSSGGDAVSSSSLGGLLSVSNSINGAASAYANVSGGVATLLNAGGISSSVSALTGDLTISFDVVNLLGQTDASALMGGTVNLSIPLSGASLSTALIMGTLVNEQGIIVPIGRYTVTSKRRNYTVRA